MTSTVLIQHGVEGCNRGCYCASQLCVIDNHENWWHEDSVTNFTDFVTDILLSNVKNLLFMATSSKNHYQYLFFDIYVDEYSEFCPNRYAF